MCNNCDWVYYLDLCDEMLLDEIYLFASDTVEKIKKWIAKSEHITDRQRVAIDNIYNSQN